MIGQALRAYLLDTDSITDIIDERIYPEVMPREESELPAIVYREESPQYVRSYGGSAGLISQNIEVACIALDYDSSKALASAVIEACEGASGTWGSTTVQGSFLQDVNSSREVDEAEVSYYATSVNLLVWFEA